MRYVVTELEGYLNNVGGGKTKPGVSCMVVDTLVNRRVLKVWRSEDMFGDRSLRQAVCRRLAAEYCEDLNAGRKPRQARQARAHGFRPTCPRPSCGHVCDAGSTHCRECGTRLGLTA